MSLAFVHDLLDQTDGIALSMFRGEHGTRAKPDATLVTLADTAIETLIRDRLADAYPQDAMLGEEFGAESGGSGRRWIIDPIDATHNFVRGIVAFATLLALERDGGLELAVVSAPALGQRWYAARGEGAYMREAGTERRIAVSRIGLWSEAHLLFASLGCLDPARDARLAAMARAAWRNRGFGDFWAHMLVAQGSAEAMVDDGLKPWDLAAPALIVTEAGGRVSDFAGRDSWLGPEAVSSNGLLHDEVLARLSPAGGG